MMKRIVISLILTISALTGYAQTTYTYRALKAYQSDENARARAYIDTAISIPSENNDAQTWLIRGYIYYEAYKLNKEHSPDYRLTSEEAFRRTFVLDTADIFEDRALKGMYNLAVTYYNDAVTCMNNTLYEKSTPYYNKYKELTRIAKPETDFVKRDIEFYNALGSLLQTMYKNDKKGQIHLWDEALEAFRKTYTLDSSDRSANYHIAILYYNRGVDLILGLPPDASLEEIFAIQDKTVELFLKSRPYMLRAYYLDPKNEDVILGLKGIYYELNDKQQIEFWDKKLKELKGPENE